MALVKKIPRRKRYFIGCEGESEKGYAAFLIFLARRKNLAIHLDSQVLGKAGDPLVLVEQAIAAVKRGEKGGKPAYRKRFLLMDTDRLNQDQQKDAKMLRIAQQNNLVLVRQDPCIEAVLLRHFNGKEACRPPATTVALQDLRRVWPDYKKGIAGQDLAKKFNLEDVHRAAKQPNQTDLKNMLEIIGLL